MDTDEFRKTGHEVVDMLADYLAGVEQQPLFPDVEPRLLDELFDEPVPQESMPADAVLGEIRRKLLPYCTHVNHPGYFGLITPTPTHSSNRPKKTSRLQRPNLKACESAPTCPAKSQ